MNLDYITELEDSSPFKLKQENLVPFREKNDKNLVQGILINMSYDKTVIRDQVKRFPTFYQMWMAYRGIWS